MKSIFLFQEIYKDRKKFSKQVFEVASSDLVNMGITVVSYTLKDIRDDEVSSKLNIKHHKVKGIRKHIYFISIWYFTFQSTNNRDT